jgi:hypothetical protein
VYDGTGVLLGQLATTNAGTGTGGIGTYTFVGTAGTPTSTDCATSGSSDPQVLAGAVSIWINMYSYLGAYDKYTIINIANEWGPVASSGNTVWRDACITAIGRLRTAGYKCMFAVDSGGSGQDDYGPKNHFAAVLAADTQLNVICAPHMYGNAAQSNGAYAYVKGLADASAANGCCYIIGEFGPGQSIGPSPTTCEPTETVAACDASNMGWIMWANGDHGNSSEPDGDGWFNTERYWRSDGYSTGDAIKLTYFGQKMVTADPNRGIKYASVLTTVT